MAADDVDNEYGGGDDKADQHIHWSNQITAALKDVEPWHTRGQKIVDIYNDKRSRGQKNTRRFNLFTANTNNLISALFGRIPKPSVTRRFNDPNDHAARTAAVIFQRALTTELENDAYFTTVAKNAIKDRLIPGAGFVWVRYQADLKNSDGESDEQPLQITDDVEAESAEQEKASPVISAESTPVEHVHWKDVLWSPARTWNEVTWMARRAYLDKEEFEERFPNAKEVVQAMVLNEVTRMQDEEEPHKENEIEVWEIWDKLSKKVYFYTEDAAEILDAKDDPYGLPNFFPCPKPLFANVTTSNLVPTPDYVFVQDQYEELNRLNARKSELIRACKVAGAYDSEQTALKDILEGEENTLIPITNWGSFVGEKGGIQGSIQWVPIGQFAQVIGLLDNAMNSIKAQIEELTGISDIVRGSTSPYETAAAQQMKGQYASMRFNSSQTEVAEFFSEMIGIKAFLMAKFYSPQNLLRQAALSPSHPDAPYVPAAIELAKNELLSHVNIEISVDALQAGNDATAVRERGEVLNAVTGIIGQAFPVIQAAPDMKPLLLQIIKSQVAGMPGARELEGVLDQELSKLLGPQPPDEREARQRAQQEERQAQQQAEQAKAQQQIQLEQAKMQQAVAIEQERGRIQLQLKQMELEHDNVAGRAKLAADMEQFRQKHENETLDGKGRLSVEQAKLQLEQSKIDLERRKLRLEELRAISEGTFDSDELELPLGDGLRTQRAEMEAQFANLVSQLEQAQIAQAQQLARLSDTLTALASQPEPVTDVIIQRDASGKIVGAQIH